MKPLFLLAALVLTFTLAGQDPPNLDTLAEQPPVFISIDSSLEAAIIETVKHLTQEGTLEFYTPDPIDVTSTQSLMDWWVFIYGLLAPLGIWIINRYFPRKKRKELIIQSTAIGILALVAIVFLIYHDLSLLIVGKAFLAFIMKAIMYDKVYKPAGLQSPKPEGYLRE